MDERTPDESLDRPAPALEQDLENEGGPTQAGDERAEHATVPPVPGS